MNLKTSVNRTVTAAAAALILLAGCQKKEEAPPPAAPSATPAIVSAEKNSFDEVTAKLDKGGNLYLYLSTEQVLGKLSDGISSASNMLSALPLIPGAGREKIAKVFAVIDSVVKSSGITQISGLGMSSIAREPGFYYSKTVIHHYPGQNKGLIWSLFGAAPHPLRQLDMLPEITAMAIGSDFDLPLAWTNIQQAAESLDLPEVSSAMANVPVQFRKLTGLDLDATLHSLGGEYGLLLTLDQHKTISLPFGEKPLEIPNPGLALLVKVNSDLIFNRVDQEIKSNAALKANPMISKVDEPDLKMRTISIPLPISIDVRPSLARVGDYLVLSSSDTLVREMLAVKSGQKKGYKATDEFKRAAQGIPDQGNNFTLVSGSFGGTMTQIQERSIARQIVDPLTLSSMQKILQQGTNSLAYSVGVNGPDGWEGFANGCTSLQSLVLPAAMVVGVAAALAIPAIAKAHNATSQYDADKPSTTPVRNIRAASPPRVQTPPGRDPAPKIPVQ